MCRDTAIAHIDAPPGEGALLLGRVLVADGAPAMSAAIRIAWIPQGGASGGRQVTFGGVTDSTGTFGLCGIPTGTPIGFRAWRDSLISVDTIVTFAPRTAIASVALHVAPPVVANLPSYRRRTLDVADPASGRPVEGVEVSDPLTGRILGHTSTAGTMSLASLPEGPSVLQLRKLGYPRRTVMVVMTPTDSAPTKILLSSATQLAPMVTLANAVSSRQAMRSGFETRKLRGIGHFMNSDELKKAEGLALSEALVKLGLRPVHRRGAVLLAGGHAAQAGPVLSAPSLPDCFVTVYIDGGLYFEALHGTDPPDFRSMYASDFAAVEYYASPAEAPVEYGGTGSGCGILVLWTRY